MPDQAVIDGTIKTGPALSATSDLPNLIPDPAATPTQPPATAPASGTPPPAETAAEPAQGAGASPEGTGAPSGDQPQLPLEPPPEPSPIRSRMADMARDRRDAQARADKLLEANLQSQEAHRQALEESRALRETLKEVLARLPGGQPNGQVSSPPEMPKPRSSDYTDPEEYYNARDEWVRQDTLREARAEAVRIAQEAEQRRAAAEQQARQQAEQQAQQAQQNELYSRWQNNVSAYAKDHPNFDIQELSERPAEEFPVTKEVLGALLLADDGPAVLDHFAGHPEDLKRIAALPEARIVREIAKIEGRLSAAALVPPPPPPAPRAPPPPANRVGSSAAAAQESMYDIGSQTGRTDEYAKMRMPQLQAERKAQMFGIRQP